MAGKDTRLACSKTIKQGRKRTPVSQQSSSGAPEPAAIDGAVQFDNDDDNEPRGLGGAPEPAALAAAPAAAPASSGQTWLGVQVTPFLQRIFEEQAARNAQSRRKAIEDFHRFSGCHSDFQRFEACYVEDEEPHPGGESLWLGAESL